MEEEGGEPRAAAEILLTSWEDLGMVETIYEEDEECEEDEESPSTSPSSAHSSSSTPASSLCSLVKSWTSITGCKPEIAVLVHDQSFYLHKEPLTRHSVYFRRRLTDSSDVPITPPSKITAGAFASAAAFCYGEHPALTPSSVAAVRAAAELLEMTGEGGLAEATEEYLELEIAGGGGAATATEALRRCAGLLPEAAAVAARCIAALDGRLDDAAALEAQEFAPVADAMRAIVGCNGNHDLLYRTIDNYIQMRRELTEEEMIGICGRVDCRNLSHETLTHLVRNPRLPLRFIVQAALLDQLHSRVTLLGHRHRCSNGNGGETLGAILQRDAVLRQAEHIRSAMEATAFRIEGLERDVDGMRRRLRRPDKNKAAPTRSESFRIVRLAAAMEGKGAPPRSESFRLVRCRGEEEGGGGEVKQKKERGLFGKKIVHGLKNIFRVSNVKSGIPMKIPATRDETPALTQ